MRMLEKERKERRIVRSFSKMDNILHDIEQRLEIESIRNPNYYRFKIINSEYYSAEGMYSHN